MAEFHWIALDCTAIPNKVANKCTFLYFTATIILVMKKKLKLLLLSKKIKTDRLIRQETLDVLKIFGGAGLIPSATGFHCINLHVSACCVEKWLVDTEHLHN